MQEERNLLKQKLLDEKITKEKHQQELYKIEVSYLLKHKALLESYGKDASDIQGQIYDKMIAEADRLTQAAKDAGKMRRMIIWLLLMKSSRHNGQH